MKYGNKKGTMVKTGKDKNPGANKPGKGGKHYKPKGTANG